MSTTHFRSFLQAGFECTVTTNRHGVEIDHLRATQHLERIDADYSMLKRVGIHTVREGLPWRWVKTENGDDRWEVLDRIASASERHGVEVIYDLCHFGYPLELDIFSSSFVDAFADYCYAFAKRARSICSSPVYVTPINEPSYFSWAGGEAAHFPPYCRGRAFELKIQMVRAIVAGTNALWSGWPEIKIVSVDPICRTVPPVDRRDLLAEAERFNDVAVFECWDMLSGRLHAELGGSPQHLGIVGVNYYWTSQWELGSAEVPLADDDERRWSLHALVRGVWQRYQCPILLSETAELNERRGPWIKRLCHEVQEILLEKIPLQGVCFYPVLGMPSWHCQETWLDMGLWDLRDREGTCVRVPCAALLEGLSAFPQLDSSAAVICE